MQNFAVVNSSHILMDGIIELFSSWMKLKKFVAWLLRLRRNLRKRIGRDENITVAKPELTETIKPLSVDEIECGEKEIVKFVQRRSFQEEINSLTSLEAPNTSTIKKSSAIYKLDPRMIKGVLCVGGRLTNAPITEESKHPVIIPKNSGISDLIARHFHQVAGHSGLEHVLSLIRERFWLVGARVVLKKMLNNCVSCKKRQAAVAKQKMAALPYHRVTPDKPPFTFVGVDCFGPFTIKRGRSLVKRYGVLFTCLTMRAVHIEVVHSLDTSSFMNALRRFIARRGQPEIIRSDNGTNFVSAEKEISNAINDWNQETIHQFLLLQNVKWLFNPPAGSHHGGIWERCIRTARKI